jgi:hypothetical protein
MHAKCTERLIFLDFTIYALPTSHIYTNAEYCIIGNTGKSWHTSSGTATTSTSGTIDYSDIYYNFRFIWRLLITAPCIVV